MPVAFARAKGNFNCPTSSMLIWNILGIVRVTVPFAIRIYSRTKKLLYFAARPNMSFTNFASKDGRRLVRPVLIVEFLYDIN